MVSTIPSLAHSLRPEDHAHRLHQGDEIQEEISVLQIIQIVGEFLARILDRGTVAVIDLGPSGDAGPDRVTFVVERHALRQALDEIGALRSITATVPRSRMRARN